MDTTAIPQPTTEKPKGLIDTIKYVLTIFTILALLSTNIATLISDTAHTTLFDGLKQALAFTLADHIANRIVSHSPTEKRKGDVVKATAVLEQDKKALQYKNAELDQHNRKISAEHDALNNKHLKLAAEHDELSVKHKKTLQLQETQATAAKKASANIAPRVIRTATRAASTLPAKVVPLAGTAITVGMTLWDINDMCETLKDINELNAAYGHAKIDQETVCGIKVPGT